MQSTTERLLDDSFPGVFDEESYAVKIKTVYEHVFDPNHAADHSIYEEVA